MAGPRTYSTKLPEDRNIYSGKCVILDTVELIGGKWKLPIIWHLADKGTVRYNELKRSVIGITNMMLAKSLKELEEAGIVARKQYSEIPPRVEYSLTGKGDKLVPALEALYRWGKEYM